MGALLYTVWKSMQPSPVMMRSAPSRRLTRSTVSSTMSTPGRSLPPRKAFMPPPRPPAAPEPGTPSTSAPRSRLTTSAKLARAVVELLHNGGGRALLRPVDRRCALGPCERVVDVAGHVEVGVGRPLIQARRVYAVASLARAAPPGGSSAPSASRSRTPRA